MDRPTEPESTDGTTAASVAAATHGRELAVRAQRDEQQVEQFHQRTGGTSAGGDGDRRVSPSEPENATATASESVGGRGVRLTSRCRRPHHARTSLKHSVAILAYSAPTISRQNALSGSQECSRILWPPCL